MAEYDGISQFLKAAPRRLNDAEELLQPPSLNPRERGADQRHLRSAMYLAGYAVECILKAYIIDRVNCQNLTEAVRVRRRNGDQIPDIAGKNGHDLTILLSLTDIEGRANADKRWQDHWKNCVQWKATWRYAPDFPKRAQAEVFIGSVRYIYGFVQRQLIGAA